MIFDNNLIFSNAFAAALTVSTGSSVIDLEGGLALNIGVGSRFGEDLGRGDGVAIPKIAAYVGTAFGTTNSATLQVAFQGSTDSNTWDTYVETDVIPAASLTAGRKIAAFDWPQVPEGLPLPRYVRLFYKVATGVFNTGSIALAGIVLQRDDNNVGQYPPGFAVGP